MDVEKDGTLYLQVTEPYSLASSSDLKVRFMRKQQAQVYYYTIRVKCRQSLQTSILSTILDRAHYCLPPERISMKMLIDWRRYIITTKILRTFVHLRVVDQQPSPTPRETKTHCYYIFLKNSNSLLNSSSVNPGSRAENNISSLDVSLFPKPLLKASKQCICNILLS